MVWDSLINLQKIIELLVQRNEANGIQAAQQLWIFLQNAARAPLHQMDYVKPVYF